MFFEYADKNFNGVGILEDFKKSSVHGQVLDSLEHQDETFWLEQFTCA
jgi:hypothetical protein